MPIRHNITQKAACEALLEGLPQHKWRKINKF